ncbi:MAG TPA: type II toxin-antitoxin system VapC family toxin [Burkholderiales bacterium]|jgi:predicted nucleic acid-binding protein
MARRPKAVVLDSWAVLAYLEDEEPGHVVAKIIVDAHEHGTSLLMTTINIGEVWYILAREVSETDAEHAIRDLKQLGVEFIDADWDLTRVAAGFKAKRRMSYADCFAAALAKVHKAELITGDKEFRQVENDVRIRWLERPKG